MSGPTPTPPPTGPETINIDYTYDPLSRLTRATYTGSAAASYRYTYDAVGNRLTQHANGTLTTYGYDHANRLTSVNGQSYTCDDNGNLTSDGLLTYAYDQANRLKQVAPAAQVWQGANTYTFGYNGVGDRLSQTVGVTTTRYVLDPSTGLTQVLADGTNTYLYGNGRLAQYQAAMQYFGADGLGSVRQLYDATGQVIATTRYDPYGNVMSQSGEATSAYGFAGEEQDAATGLEYLRARYYSSYLNQWIQPDSIIPNVRNPQTLNRYSYGLNNPVKYTDPSGHAACIDEECDLLQNPTNDDVIVSHASNPVYRLILEVSQGNTSAADTLNRVLADTSGTGMSPLGDNTLGSLAHTNFRGLGALRGGRGFMTELDDDYLYAQPRWGGRTRVSTQLGHFLTAVNMGYDGSDSFLRAIVGHEVIGDSPQSMVQAWRAATDAEVASFRWGIVHDMQGDTQARDADMASILNPAVHGPLAERPGNSMEDLRLSARGWALGRMVSLGEITTNRGLANWILHNIAGY